MSFQNEYENYLSHEGVKGMRWGVRKGKQGIKGLGKTVGTLAKPGVQFIGRNIKEGLRFAGRSFKAGAKTIASASRGEDVKKSIKKNSKSVKKAFNDVKNKPIKNYKTLKKDYKELFN